MSPRQVDEMEGPVGGASARGPRRWWGRIALALAGLVVVGASSAWLSRERIATDLIDDYLSQRGVPATYDIVSLAPQEQVIENLVIGDPALPDLTVRRMVIETGVGWSGPELRRVRVEGVRAYASVKDGAISLGAADPLIFTGSDAPFALPAIDLTLIDARALVVSDFGRVGLAVEGAGRLDDGFAGRLAASAPGIGVEGCRAQRATLYGALTTANGAPAFDGPLRLAGLACAGASLARADIGAKASLARDLAEADADFRIEGGGAAYGDVLAAGLAGVAELGWSDGRLAFGHDLALTAIAAPQGRLARLEAEGNWRGTADGASGQWEGSLRGDGLAPAPGLTASLAAAERGAEGSLAAPLIAKLRSALASGLSGADLRAEAIIRHKGGEASLTIPEARLATRTGAPLAALSRGRAVLGAGGLSRVSGDLMAGGAGLPAINARITQDSGGGWSARAAMADYAAGASRLAVPSLTLRAAPGGTIAFAGSARASGALPGGAVNDLTLPITGSWSEARGLAVGTACTPLRFAKLALSDLRLDAKQVTLCPERGRPILAYDGTLRLAARTGPLELSGTFGDAPARLAASAMVLRYPQPFALEGLAATIGTGDDEMHLAAASLTGSPSASGAFAGKLEGGLVRAGALPVAIDALAGRWSFAEGALVVTDGAFTATDRPEAGATPRFAPLAVAGARMTLAYNRITGNATVRHAATARSLAEVAIAHNLDTSAGGARISVPGLVFDDTFQPGDLSELARGVIALADGTLTGSGRIDWQGDTITSSGAIGSDGFDFAAAFGPVRGLAGTVVFTDLLNLTTAPDQRLTIAAINPGVEVLAGTVQFELKDGTLLALEDARFPFMGGTLTMRPLVMDFSRPEERRYIFDIAGLDAARFVAQMELSNISATGIFDGTVPVVFDTEGRGRIEGGVLVAREGGGNVAYVGELSYEDLGTMGNYAFSALRSLDYRQMRVGLGGDLTGEIITSFAFDGVRQGAGTSTNFVTRRLAALPIQFRINVRSENFYELATMVRSFWDVEYLADPRARFKTENGRLVPVLGPVQPPESEDRP